VKRAVKNWVMFLAALSGGAASAASFPPFYARVQTEEGSFFAVRPLYSHTTAAEGAVRDVFWPLYSRKEFKDEKSSRGLIFWFTHEFDVSSESPRFRRWLLPFYFQGRDVHGESYGALFPAGGTIREFLGRDEIRFVLFPVYANSRINEVRTTSVLWPIYSRTRGNGIQRDRVFPLYGKSVLEEKYEKKFVLWPFWNSAEYFYPGDSGKVWVLFPVCGRADLEKEQTLWLLPPFFRFTKGDRQDRIFCPWPFIQKVDNERYDRIYLWPLWGRDRYKAGLKQRNFLLWPLLWSERSEEADRSKTRRMAVPFLYLQRTFQMEEGVPKDDWQEIASLWKIWPLMSLRREGEVSRFRMLELWPVSDSPPIERNWAPLWTLYRRTADEEGVIRRDLLWFAWNSERDPEGGRREWSLLKGLLAYKREGDARTLRLFYFMRFGE